MAAGSVSVLYDADLCREEDLVPRIAARLRPLGYEVGGVLPAPEGEPTAPPGVLDAAVR